MNILVYGYYGAGNLGDNLFAEVFQTMFPEHSFVFTRQLLEGQVKDADAIIFGGGSFLDGKIQASTEILQLVKSKKIMYVGVGAETNIDAIHQELMSLAQLVIIRNSEFIDKVKKINSNSYFSKDLVYWLKPQNIDTSIKKKILVITNIETVPSYTSEHYKHSSWQYFISEMSQALDQFRADGYGINFFTMCQNDTMSDSWATASLITMMNKRSTGYQLLFNKSYSFLEVANIFKEYDYVISQRLHGAILADICGKNHTIIHHHDKLKYVNTSLGTKVPYYGLNKQMILDSVYKKPADNQLSVEEELSLDDLKQKINNCLLQ